NLKCSYCGVVDNSRPDPSLPDIYYWLDISKKVGCMGVSLFGGEPFLRKDLEQIVKVATFKNLYTQLSTNLTLVDERKLDRLSDFGLGELRFSIDGMQQWEHSKKVHSTLANNVDQLLKRKDEWNFNIAATLVLTPNNWRGVLIVLDYLKQYEIPLSIVPLEPKKIRNINPPIHETYRGFTYEQIRMVAEELVHAKRNGALIDVSEDYLFQIPNYWVGKADWECKAGLYTFTVDVDGKIGFCSSIDAYNDPIDIMKDDKKREHFRFRSKFPKQWCTKVCLSGCQFNTSYYGNHWVDFLKTYMKMWKQ
ncbi:MAG: radical SAM protein, partial [Thermodesulfovibrionia bacterium]|nr:radical SAM protein [Thermodesulfovibrionia bacterium]